MLQSFPPPLPYLPCEDQYVQTWLNRADVQAALHVIPGSTQSGWTDCVNDTRWNYDYSGFYLSQLPTYTRAMNAGLQIVTYSGTADTVVPYLGTSRWVFNLMGNATATEPWHAWTTPEHPHQAAGFTVRWNSFRFITIRNAGHLVPQGHPEQALVILQMLLGSQ
jgi:serine carboxypeptidase-like clade 2